ncbi:MAG TPA: hypothetical protein VGH01_10475 [Jatrophihabitantaceae bacterium]|jgi:hypothetical protein
MPTFDRDELDEFWQGWLDGNRKAQELGDWSILADFYAPDASYGWSYTPTDHFMATGREEIRDLALGTEMLGFQGWIYPYQASVIDERTGMIVGFWRQVTTFAAPSGEPYEINGLGCSWFRYGGERQWAWQRDIFDYGLAMDAVVKVIQDGNMTPQLERRIQATAAGAQPGHYPSVAALSSPLWPVARISH